MKKYSQCLLCKYVFGRKCELNGSFISEDIYNNDIKCTSFSSLANEELDCDDSCCNENSKYYDKKAID